MNITFKVRTMLGKLVKKLRAEKDDLKKKGVCPLCSDIIQSLPTIVDKDYNQVQVKQEEEPLYNLCGIEVCEGCYFDLLNHMGYKNIDDLLPCDKKQLNKFLNLISEAHKRD